MYTDSLMFLINSQCTTAAGFDKQSLFNALLEGRDCSETNPYAEGRICAVPGWRGTETFRAAITRLLANNWQGAWSGLSPQTRACIANSRTTLVFASTKGNIEDYIWKTTAAEARTATDPFHGIVEDFVSLTKELSFTESITMTNACASSHVALEYIADLFADNRCDNAVLITADLIGPFVAKGFSTLKVASPTRNRPFSGDRDGLQLGDAVSCLLLSKTNFENAPRLVSIASETEGTSITRPSGHGRSLARAIGRALPMGWIPDLIVAHGTGTKFNDAAEDAAFIEHFKGVEKPAVTGVKWCTGHTLGSSGAIDLIAASECLRSQKAFALNNTLQADPTFQMPYLSPLTKPPLRIQRILVTSLGFGGVHAALALEAST